MTEPTGTTRIYDGTYNSNSLIESPVLAQKHDQESSIVDSGVHLHHQYDNTNTNTALTSPADTPPPQNQHEQTDTNYYNEGGTGDYVSLDASTYAKEKTNENEYANSGFGASADANANTDPDADAGADDGNEEDIQIDVASQIVTYFVYIAVVFCSLLFVAIVIFTISVARRYGVVTFAVLGLLLFIATFIGIFVYKILQEDEGMEPLRRKLQQWNVIATTAVVREIQNFQLDMKENLLLTDGGGQWEDDNVDEAHQVESDNGKRQKKRRGGDRNKIFGVAFKSFLKKKDGKKRFNFGAGRSRKRGNIDETDIGIMT